MGCPASLPWSLTAAINSFTRSWVDASSLDPSFGVGVVYQPIEDRLWLGASYQSMPYLVGGLELEGELKTVFANGTESTNTVDFHTELPDVYRLGGRYRPSTVTELRLFFDYQRWSVLDNHCVSGVGEECEVAADGSAEPGSDVILNQVRDWNDTFGARAGASYWAVDEVELFAGAGFSSNAVPAETLEPALQDYDSVSAALGGRFELAEWLYLATSYTQVFYLSRDTSGESIHPDLLGPNGTGSPSEGPPSGGRYSQQLGLFNVNVEAIF